MSGQEAQQGAPAPGTIERIRPRQLSQRDPAGLARAIAESKFWKHITTSAQAMVVMAAGEELGLTPLAAVQGITIIEGRVGYTGNLVATLVKQKPDHDYRIKAKTNERCEIEFGPAPAPARDVDGEWLPWPDAYGSSEFTIEDAERAELVKPRSNWVKYPRAMCFNRALTEGIRSYIPDITAGTPVYTDEEIREVIHVEAEVEEAEVEELLPLDDEWIDHLAKGIDLAKPTLGANGVNSLDGLNVLLGSLGIDGLSPNAPLRDELAKLTDEQADALDAELQRIVAGQDDGDDDEGGESNA